MKRRQRISEALAKQNIEVKFKDEATVGPVRRKKSGESFKKQIGEKRKCLFEDEDDNDDDDAGQFESYNSSIGSSGLKLRLTKTKRSATNFTATNYAGSLERSLDSPASGLKLSLVKRKSSCSDIKSMTTMKRSSGVASTRRPSNVKQFSKTKPMMRKVMATSQSPARKLIKRNNY